MINTTWAIFYIILIIVVGLVIFTLYTIKSNKDDFEKFILLVGVFVIIAPTVCFLLFLMANSVWSAWG